MNGDSILQYNGIQLPYVRTEKFSQEVIYSPDGVDSIYTKLSIGVSCVLNSCLLNGTEVTDWIRNARPALLTRGAQLFFTMDGEYLYNSTCDTNPINVSGGSSTEVVASPNYNWSGTVWGTTAYADAKLGPKPIRFDTRQINGGTWLCYFEIETYIPFCEGAVSNFLSNRWEVTVDVDEEYFITRTINGILVINGQYALAVNNGIDIAINEIGLNDSSHSLIIPPCPNRWKRDNIKIVRSSDGLTINYTIVDKQLYVAMPNPATKIDAQYTETSGSKDFALLNMQICEIVCTVYGEPNASYDPTGTIDGGSIVYNSNNGLDYIKYNLMKLMFQVVFSRIPNPFIVGVSSTTDLSNTYIIQYFQIKEDVFKPMVGCTVRALRPRQFKTNPVGKTLLASGGIFSLTNVGQPIPIGDILADVARQPQNLGNYGTFLIAQQALKLPESLTTLTPCQLSSAIMSPCDSDEYRSIQTLISSTQFYQGNTTLYVTDLPASVTNPSSYPNNPGYGQLSNTYYSDANYKNPFTEYTVDVQYITEQHMLQLPIMYDVASTGSCCVFSQTGASCSKKLCHWKASRIGAWPMSPKPTDLANPSSSPSNDQLLSYHLTYADCELMQDGITRRYETGGIYEVGMAVRVQWDASSPTATIPTIVNPITNDVWGSPYSTYPVSSFVSGIVGYSTISPGGTPS